MAQINDTNRRFILASGSPRRLELMSNLGFEPEVRVSSIPEQRQPEESPTDYTRRLALAKAEDVRDSLEDEDALPDWILAADTIVIFDGEVLEKPADADDAFQMLRNMSGRDHVVETSFCWLQRSTGRSSVCTVQADVEFRELTDEMIHRYLDSGEPFDKAGSYGIQLLGSAFVRSVDGSYFAVVGLPVCEVVEELQKLGGLEGFPFRT
ncbi:septum formation inhibitor Maf [Persicimonas caeni]|uniref:dTTP/UTP pyrophosphatase n=1 Tax=Persicimonas caeni TaxID=2292766 RepID=A0A4Y6Q2T2_PERCE|nr:Maf family protein [Persicimonas caeni]QDG54487.1 septum formation inhibitor Maf [Persicimonas caeni]QED35708.1 septum formation inhibitor Maf [Persicimonas caeni]